MNIKKLLFLFSRSHFEKMNFLGNRMVFRGFEAGEGGTPPSAAEARQTRMEEEQQHRQDLEAEPTADLPKKDPIEEVLDTLTQDTFEAILKEGKLTTTKETADETGKTSSEEIETNLIQLSQTQVEKLITFANSKDEKQEANLSLILEKIEDDAINPGQLSIESLKILFAYLKTDKGALKEFLTKILVSGSIINQALEACDGDQDLTKTVFGEVLKKNKAFIKVLDTVNLIRLIQVGLYDDLKKELSPNQRIWLLTSSNKTVNSVIKIHQFDAFYSHKELNQTRDYLNVMVLYCVQENEEYLESKVIPKLTPPLIDRLNPKVAEELLSWLNNNEKKHADTLNLVLENLNTETKQTIISENALPFALVTKLNETLPEDKKVQFEKPAETAGEKPDESFFKEFDEKTSFENKLAAAFAGEDYKTGRSLVFSVAGVERSFRIRPGFKAKIKGCKSPAEVKKTIYEHLLNVITKDGSIITNKWEVGKGGDKFGESNATMILEIERLEAMISKAASEKTPTLTYEEEEKASTEAKKRLEVITSGAKDSKTTVKDFEEAAPKIVPQKPKVKTDAQPEVSEVRDNLENLTQLKKILGELLKDQDLSITQTETSLEITYTPPGSDLDTNLTYTPLSITPNKDKGLTLSYEHVFVKDSATFQLDTNTSNFELKTFITAKISDIKREYDLHREHVDYFFKPERLKETATIKDGEIKSFDGEVDNGNHEWERNWERISGHEKIDQVFKTSPFKEALDKAPYNKMAAKDRVPALIRTIVQKGEIISYSDLDLEDILDVTDVFTTKDLQSIIKKLPTSKETEALADASPEEGLTKILSIIGLTINNKETSPELRASLLSDYRNVYNIFLGSAVILQTLGGATLQAPEMGPLAPSEVPPVASDEYQYVGNFETSNGTTTAVYTGKDGALYSPAGSDGSVEPLYDPVVRAAAEKTPEFKAALGDAKETAAKKKYLEYLQKSVGSLDVDFKTEIKGTKLEITMNDYIKDFPKFYLEPQVEFNESTKSWTLKDIELSYLRYFVGDSEKISLGKTPTKDKLRTQLRNAYEENIEDMQDHENFKLPELDDLNFDSLNEPFSINDPQIRELADGNLKDWIDNFNNLAHHGLYRSILTQHFGVSSEQDVPKIILDVIQRGLNSRLDFGDFLEVTKVFAKEDESSNVGPTTSDEFATRFKFLIKQLKGGELKLTKADGSPDKEALAKRDQYMTEFRSMYNIYIGTLKLLRTIASDTFKPAEDEAPSETFRHQIDSVKETDKAAYLDQYFNFDQLVSGETPKSNEGNTQIGISKEAYENFMETYIKATGIEADQITDFELSDIFRTLLRAYTARELLTMDGVVGKQAPKDGVTKMVLLKLPENFKAESTQVKLLMSKFHDTSLGETPEWSRVDAKSKEQDHLDKSAEAQRALSRDIKVYKAKVFKLLKAAEARDKAGILEWAFSDGVSSEEEIILGKGAEYFDAGTIRRFTSPEAMVDHLFSEKQIKIPGEKDPILLFKFENGVQKINEEGLIQYFNHLIKEGLRRKQLLEKHRETKADFDSIMASRGFLIGTWGRETGNVQSLKPKEKEAKLAYDTFKKTGKSEDWEKIPGHERIDELLTSSPFGLSTEDVAKKMHELFADEDVRSKVWMGKIFDKFIKEQIKGYKPINNKVKSPVDSVDKIEDEYEHILDTMKELHRMIEEDDFEGSKEEKLTKKMAAQGKLSEFTGKYYELMSFVEPGSRLLQRIQRLGESVPQMKDLELKLGEGQSFLDLEINAQQIDILNGGYISELMKDDASQLIQLDKVMERVEFSKLPNIAKIQKDALKAGYPVNKVGNIESKILGAGLLSMKGDKITGAGIAIPIPLGEDFTLILAGTTTGAEVGFYYKVVESSDKKYTGALAGSLGVGFDGKGFGKLAWINTHQVSDTLDFSWGFGVLMTAVGPVGTLGIGLNYNEKRATELATAEIQWLDQFDQVEKAESATEKAKIIRSLERFKELSPQLEDQDIIAVYEEWKNENIMAGFEKGKPPTPFTGIGIGVTFPPPGGYIGIKIRLGETILIKPRTGERERLAQLLSSAEISAQIDRMTKGPNPAVTFEEYKSSDIFIDARGVLSISTGAALRSEGYTSDLNALNQAFEQETNGISSRMRAEKAKIKIGEEEKEVIELKILDTDNKDVSVYIDHDCLELNDLVFDKKLGRIYLPSLESNLIITRETFKYPYRKSEKGNATTDVIIITTNPNFNRNTVINESNKLLEKRWEDGKPKRWDIMDGPQTAGISKIHTISEYNGPAPLDWNYQAFKEKIFGMPAEDFNEIVETAGETTKALGGKSLEEIKEQPSRFVNNTALAKDIYAHLLKKGMKSGGELAITESEALIKETNSYLSKLKPKQEKLNDKEAGQLLAFIQHEYFVNLWKGGEAKVREAFDKHNRTITKNLAKEFEKKFDKAGIKAPEGLTKAAYALKLAEKIQANAKTNFEKTLADLKTNLVVDTLTKDHWDQIAVAKLSDESLASFIFYTGTTVRTGKEKGKGLLAGGVRMFDFPDPSISKMGIIGELSKENPMPWRLDDPNQENRDIAKLILETTSPRPTLENYDSFYSPIALKLSTFPGTGIEIGKAQFRQLSEFYKLDEAKQIDILNNLDSNPQFKDALTAFVKFADKVRTEMLTPSIQPKEIKLKNGTRMLFGASLYTASYGECGNLSVLAREEFVIVNSQNFVVASTSKYIHPNTQIRKEVWEFVIGISWEAAPEEEGETPNADQEGQVDVGAAGEGESMQTGNANVLKDSPTIPD